MYTNGSDFVSLNMFNNPFLLFTVNNPNLSTELNLLQGGFYGALTILGIYNLFLFGFTRSRSYLFYVGFIVSFLCYQLVHNGTALHYFWPEQVTFNTYVYPLLFTLNTLAISFFVPSFLNLYERNSNAFRFFRGFSALILASMLAFPVLKLELIEPLYNILSIVLTLTALVAGVFYWLMGKKAARFFTLAWACYMAGIVIANTGNTQAYPFGALICILLLGVALADRLTQKQKHEYKAHDFLLGQQTKKIEQMNEYVNLYQNSLVGQFQLDSEGYFVKTNAAWREMLGYRDEQQFMNENPQFDSLFSEHKQRRRFWRKLKENGELRTYLVNFIQPTTHERIIVSLTIRQDNATHYEWFGSGQDVTENYLKEQTLIQLQQEKAQSLRQLVLGLSEEIEVPINKLQAAENYLRIDEEQLAADAKVKLTQGTTLLRQSEQRFHELNQLMRDAIVNENEYPMANIRIRDWLAAWQQEHLNGNEQLQLKYAVHSYLVEWPSYPEALKIILDQLLKFTCTVNAELLAQDAYKVMVELREHGEFLELHYSDNGRTFTDSEQANFFMPFHLTDSGVHTRDLGLFQSYNLITELLEGVIEWPETEEGIYLLVRFNMPLPASAS